MLPEAAPISHLLMPPWSKDCELLGLQWQTRHAYQHANLASQLDIQVKKSTAEEGDLRRLLLLSEHHSC